MPEKTPSSFDHVFKTKKTFVARSLEERKVAEPHAQLGDTEWSICHRFGISSFEFRKWNEFDPSKASLIKAGEEYVVGWEKKSFQNKPPSSGEQNEPIKHIGSDSSDEEEEKDEWGEIDFEPIRTSPFPDWILKSDRDFPDHNITKPILKFARDLRPSIRLQEYIRSWERPPGGAHMTGQIFRDTRGKRTIGFGHYINDIEYPEWVDYDPERGGDKFLSLNQMEDLFYKDLEKLAAEPVRRLFGNLRMRQGQFDALVDLVFHRGGRSPVICGLHDYLQETKNVNNNEAKIRACFHYYDFWDNRETGERIFMEGFKKRRNQELDMFFDDIYTLHV